MKKTLFTIIFLIIGIIFFYNRVNIKENFTGFVDMSKIADKAVGTIAGGAAGRVAGRVAGVAGGAAGSVAGPGERGAPGKVGCWVKIKNPGYKCKDGTNFVEKMERRLKSENEFIKIDNWLMIPQVPKADCSVNSLNQEVKRNCGDGLELETFWGLRQRSPIEVETVPNSMMTSLEYELDQKTKKNLLEFYRLFGLRENPLEIALSQSREELINEFKLNFGLRDYDMERLHDNIFKNIPKEGEDLLHLISSKVLTFFVSVLLDIVGVMSSNIKLGFELPKKTSQDRERFASFTEVEGVKSVKSYSIPHSVSPAKLSMLKRIGLTDSNLKRIDENVGDIIVKLFESGKGLADGIKEVQQIPNSEIKKAANSFVPEISGMIKNVIADMVEHIQDLTYNIGDGINFMTLDDLLSLRNDVVGALVHIFIELIKILNSLQSVVANLTVTFSNNLQQNIISRINDDIQPVMKSYGNELDKMNDRMRTLEQRVNKISTSRPTSRGYTVRTCRFRIGGEKKGSQVSRKHSKFIRGNVFQYKSAKASCSSIKRYLERNYGMVEEISN